MNKVSDICEIDNIIVEYFTTNELVYAGFPAKPLKKDSPYIFVNCNAAPSNIEKIKNKAILYFSKILHAFSPSCSINRTFFALAIEAHLSDNLAKLANSSLFHPFLLASESTSDFETNVRIIPGQGKRRVLVRPLSTISTWPYSERLL